MNPETILKLVLLLGVVLLVVAIGIRARLEDLLRLLRSPALALRAMAAMYVALPAFVLLVVWLVPLQAGVGAVLLGFAVAPVLPPWAKKAAAAGGRADQRDHAHAERDHDTGDKPGAHAEEGADVLAKAVRCRVV